MRLAPASGRSATSISSWAGWLLYQIFLTWAAGLGWPITAYLIQAGHKVIGIDSSAAMLALARAQVPGATYFLRYGTRIRLRKAADGKKRGTRKNGGNQTAHRDSVIAENAVSGDQFGTGNKILVDN